MPKRTDKPQIEKFREAARALASVKDEEYDDAVTKVAHAPKLTNEQIKELARQAAEKRKS